ncbi:MAG TPA: HoxN/HupN/NixA family nickel/cobalt transporter [Candidatus Methylacidiphilales bacterium]|nr:HoxN/HupN/NixA family nickel/cobalt transporter [Candidatus Methylacidiphilales bacterium]
MADSAVNGFDSSTFAVTNLRGRITALITLLIGINVAAWIWALASFHAFPLLLGTAVLAYSFGLRHAVDADHIAAIDNVTRKLMQQGQRPVGVGFFFSLGHSTIVFGLSVAIALTSIALKDRFDSMKNIGGIIGTTISAFFLFAIAFINIVILVGIWRTFQAVRRGEPYLDEDLNLILARRGFFARIFRSLFRLVSHSWQMYFVGFLFGLGFDTATEVGVLGISATEASKGLPIWSILVFPVLFASGMALIDSLDSLLMLGAYGWAFFKPVRKLYYNMTITFVSVVVAFFIGSIEVLGLIGDQFQWKGPFWSMMDFLNGDVVFTNIGFIIIGIFAVSWIVSIIIYRIKKYDEIEVRTSAE